AEVALALFPLGTVCNGCAGSLSSAPDSGSTRVLSLLRVLIGRSPFIVTTPRKCKPSAGHSRVQRGSRHDRYNEGGTEEDNSVSEQEQQPVTHYTWNPWRGCTKVSPGCKNCYMFRDQRRYGLDPTRVVRTKTWREPARWQKKAGTAGRVELVFTCSWSDWFHEDADPWRREAW